MTRLLIIPLFLFFSCSGNTTQTTKSNTANYQIQVEKVKSDTILAGIQNKIYKAFVQSIILQNNKPLVELSNKLENLYKNNSQNLILYWQSYLQFYSSIYYLKNDDKKTAEKEIDKGIDWMENMNRKNSEDYALLAMLQGFGIQFKGMRAMFIAGDTKKNVKTAIALDSANLRAYYVYANNDFYTPEKYGGGKEVEKYLLKALSLPSQKIKNNYLPSWGKEESYELLIRFYIRTENYNLAKKYFRQAITKYPDSYLLNKLASKLVEK